MRNIVIALLAASICLCASNAFAGRIFGDIKLDGKPVPAGLPVTVAAVVAAAEPGAASKPGPLADSTATDQYGSYKLNVKQIGKCVLTLVYQKQTLALEVFSYKVPTRYDLVLEKKDGKLSLRRK